MSGCGSRRGASRGSSVEAIAPLARSGMGTAAIARAIGVSLHVARKRIDDYDLRRWIDGNDGFAPPSWRALAGCDRGSWIDIGLSTGRPLGQVAAAMGVTRNTLATWMAARDGRRAPVIPPLRAVRLAHNGFWLGRASRRIGGRHARAFDRRLADVDDALEAGPAWDPLPASRPVAALDRGGGCAWPLWRAGERDERHRMCGAPADPGRSYCRAHAALALRRGAAR